MKRKFFVIFEQEIVQLEGWYIDFSHPKTFIVDCESGYAYELFGFSRFTITVSRLKTQYPEIENKLGQKLLHEVSERLKQEFKDVLNDL